MDKSTVYILAIFTLVEVPYLDWHKHQRCIAATYNDYGHLLYDLFLQPYKLNKQRILHELMYELIKRVGGEKIRCEALPSILSVFPNEFNKFNNTGARMQDSIYHMTLKSHFISKFCIKTLRFHH